MPTPASIRQARYRAAHARVRLDVELDPEDVARLDALAERTGETRTALIRALIRAAAG